MPLLARRQLELGAEKASILRRSIDIDFGHGQDQPVAARGADEGERDAGIARGRLDQHGARADLAPASIASIIADPDPVLDAAERIEELELERTSALDAVRRGQARMRTSGVLPIVSTMLS